MENPLVTVIITVFNAKKVLKNSVDSILNQTYRNLEILIADDNSSDGSREIIELISDPRVRKFYNKTNRGYLKTCNPLFLEAKGDFITFQDADDISDITRIEKQLKHFEKNPEISLCGTNFIRETKGIRKHKIKSNLPCSDETIREFICRKQSLPFCGASVMLKKEVLNELGGYREIFDRIGQEHFDFFLRISEKHKVANLSSHLYSYFYVSNSFSRENIDKNPNKFFNSKIVWFLKQQRETYGKDATDDFSLQGELDNFLFELKKQFEKNKKEVYQRLISSSLLNFDYSRAFILYLGSFKDLKSFSISFFYWSRLLKTLVKDLVQA